MSPRRAVPPGRLPLSRERVVAAGIRLADTRGVDSVSMRRVGDALEVEAMSLYRYVASKDELLDAMVDGVIAEFPAPDEGLDWHGRLRSLVLGGYLVLIDHPWAAALGTSRPAVGAARQRFGDAVLSTLIGGGCTVELAHAALHALENHVFGFTLQEFHVESGMRVREPTHDRDAEFIFVLDVLIAGIENAMPRAT
jgi:AcrR family transcriptional regulator